MSRLVGIKSEVWKYFIKDKISKNSSKCRLCLGIVKTSGNTTNLKNHLKRKHTKVYQSLSLEKSVSAISSSDSEIPEVSSGSECLDDPMKDEASHNTEIHERGNEENSTSVNGKRFNNKMSAEPKENYNSCSSSQSSTPMNLFEAESIASTSSISSDMRCLLNSKPKHFPSRQPLISESISKLESFAEGGAKATRITNSLLFMIAKDNLPLDTTEKEGFKHLMQIVAPLYKLPGRHKITSLIEERYTALFNVVKNELKHVDSLCITCDVWTETMTTTSYLGITVHYLYRESFKSVDIGVEELSSKHTAQYLGERLKSVCLEWEIDLSKVSAVITDNGANIVKCVNDVFSKNKHLPCFAHTLNLVASRIIEDPAVKQILEKIKSIVTYFKQSVSAADQLRAAQNSDTKLKLIQSVPTRWNSTFYMVERFLELSQVVTPILLKNLTSPSICSAAEMQVCRELIFILKPIEQVSKEVSGEKYLTCSKIIPMANCLKNKILKLELLSPEIEQLKQTVVSEISKRFGAIEDNHILSLSTLLDPRFKKIHFCNPSACARAINSLDKLLKCNAQMGSSRQREISQEQETISTQENTDSIWSYHKELATSQKSLLVSNNNEMSFDLKAYLNLPTVPLKSNPISFWSNYNSSDLATLAKRYLSIVGSSVPSERIFSQAGNILTQTRNRLNGKHLSQLLFLHSLDISYWFD
ncbi:unnamed protein product [Callosobruchus maculatus]|uniref:BED-type domain-containing protein n=1 Tax=Callosobruchus maculatus TaxID=64391 RepID=A0A653CYX7_CALMS|nr:unnamed protein product [Callosobruchus maculatus]